MGSSPSIRLPLELMARLQFLFQHQRIRLHNWFPGWREQLHPGGGGGGGGWLPPRTLPVFHGEEALGDFILAHNYKETRG